MLSSSSTFLILRNVLYFFSFGNFSVFRMLLKKTISHKKRIEWSSALWPPSSYKHLKPGFHIIVPIVPNSVQAIRAIRTIIWKLLDLLDRLHHPTRTVVKVKGMSLTTIFGAKQFNLKMFLWSFENLYKLSYFCTCSINKHVFNSMAAILTVYA